MLPRLASPNAYSRFLHYGALINTIQYTQPYNQSHNNAYGIIKPLYTINDTHNYTILSVHQPITQLALMPCLSSIMNNISKPTAPLKYTNIPQRNMSQLQRNNSNDAINVIRGILSRLSRCFLCYLYMKPWN